MSLYLEHFGLNEAPFRITPHTDFFFDGADRGTTLEALLYATLHEEGIVKVVGEVGSGKTMLCRVLMERLPAHVETVYLANPSFSRDEILLAVAEELKIDVMRERVTGALHALQTRLIESHAAGRRTVILIDEAHAMPEEALEQVRLLSNLETSRHKLLQIVLFGQPELDAVLATSSMRQLKDRITHSFRMRPLAAREVAPYLTFRMRAAGYRGPDVFDADSVARLARASGGLTRRINILADKALLAAFSEGVHGVSAKQAKAAIADSEFAARARGARPLAAIGTAALAGALVAGGAAYWALRPVRTPTALSTPRAPATSPASPAPPAPVATPTSPVPPASPASPRPAPASPRLSADQRQRLESYRAAGQPMLAARLAASLEKLQSAPDEHYTLELYVSDNSNPARLERFLARARDLVPLESVYLLPLPGNGQYRVWALYGDYPNRGAAAQAAKRLPPKYQRAFPLEPRSFADLRHAI